jgi:hypothetical protein
MSGPSAGGPGSAAGEVQAWRELAASALSLSDDKLVRVAHLLESIRGQPGIPDALSLLRGRLVTIRPLRRLDAQRLMFLPAEDLLDNADSYRRHISRICRATLARCWPIIVRRIGADAVRGLDARLKAAEREAEVIELGAGLWAQGAVALRQALDEAERNAQARLDLFGRDEDVLRQVATLLELTELGTLIQQTKSRLPDRPITALGEAHLEAIREGLQQAAGRGLTAATLFLVTLAARMQRPGELLDVLADSRVEMAPGDKETVAGDVAVLTVEHLLRQSTEMTATRLRSLHARDIAGAAERLLDGLASLEATLARPDQRRLAQRAQHARTAISGAVRSRVVEPADRELFGTLADACGEAGVLAGLPVDLPGRDSSDRAEAFARAYRRCSRIAPMVGLRTAMQEKTEEICRLAGRITERYWADNAASLRDPACLALADERLVALIRLVEIVGGADQAEQLLTAWEERVVTL